MTSRDNHPRESIWSLRREDRPRFSYYFATLFIIGTGWMAWYQIYYVTHDSVVETVMAIFLGVIQSGIVAVTITFFRFEGEDAMGIALDIWREKRRRERDEMIAKAVEEATAGSRAQIKALKKRIAEKSMVVEAVAEKDAQIEALKKRIAELEKSNGNSSG